MLYKVEHTYKTINRYFKSEKVNYQPLTTNFILVLKLNSYSENTRCKYAGAFPYSC